MKLIETICLNVYIRNRNLQLFDSKCVWRFITREINICRAHAVVKYHILSINKHLSTIIKFDVSIICPRYGAIASFWSIIFIWKYSLFLHFHPSYSFLILYFLLELHVERFWLLLLGVRKFVKKFILGLLNENPLE